ncbi:MAG: hypothetical protein MJY87_11350 [Fibrobacter sp.]|nr:hypothetical protein [Fibrobacter sp.]
MKFPYVLTAIAMTTSIALAQEQKAPATPVQTAETPAAAEPTKAPVAAEQAVPTQEQPAPVQAEPSSEQASPVVEQPAVPATAQSEQAAPAEAPVQPAEEAAPQTAEAEPAADSTLQGQPVTDSTVAAQEPAPQDSVASVPQTAAVDTANAKPVSVFVADTTPPPAKLLTGTKLEGRIHGFLRADQSPYLVEDQLLVEAHSILVIEPGVVLLFAPNGSLHVQGQIVVAGTRGKNVEFKSASSLPKNGDWKGIVISSDEKSEIRNALISGAENGIILENSKLSLQSTTIEKTTGRGLYAKNSQLEVSDCYFFDNEGVALHSSNYTVANVERVKFIGNKIALLNSELSQTDVTSSSMEENAYAVVDKGNSYLTFNNTKVQQNQVGAVSNEVLEKSVLASIANNTKDFETNVSSLLGTVPQDPEVAGIQSRAIAPNETINDLILAKEKESFSTDTTKKSWSIIGNVMLGGNYHYVQTRKNHSHTPDIIGADTIEYKKHYKNYMQVPGFGAEASAYMLMTAPDGSTLEFNTDLTVDSWNHFAPNPVTLTYKDSRHQLIVGDNQKTAGDIYMASLPLFGIDYTLSLLTNNAKEPLFQLNAFGGENQRPLLIGDRHPDLYNNYIEEGESQAQRMAYGASIKWAPVRRFDATVGILYANDEIEDPLLRDGSVQSSISSEPMQTSFTAFADGNWLFYPGDIELKGMIAVGRADTAMVQAERAINQVFADADVNVSSYAKIRELMAHENKINTLSNRELLEIFGETSTLTYREMRETLKILIQKAKMIQQEKENDIDDSRFAGLNWGSQNFAIGASLNWNIYKTKISGHIKYVGEDFYSVGSPDQRADTREFGGNLEQFITKFWTLKFAYDLNVENAANGSKTNLFGLGEGTRWGFFGEASDKWLDEHDQDKDRTKYIQKFDLTNNFKIGQRVDLKVGYNLDFRTQSKNTQLHGDYILEDGIYQDKWFKPRKNKAVATIEVNGEEHEVDDERWNAYMDLATEPYLASRLNERSLKHNWNIEASLKAFKSVIKVGGSWTLRTDISEFERDSLIKDMKLADTTWEKLGYYFGGADFFEQSYPVSVSSSLSMLQNQISITPRFKSYTRDNMSEAEIIIEDEFEMPLKDKFFVLGANFQFRHQNTSWDEDGDEVEEAETDILGSVNLRVNHTRKLYSEWFTGAALYYRPDNRSDEYKDIYGGVRVYYSF